MTKQEYRGGYQQAMADALKMIDAAQSTAVAGGKDTLPFQHIRAQVRARIKQVRGDTSALTSTKEHRATLDAWLTGTERDFGGNEFEALRGLLDALDAAELETLRPVANVPDGEPIEAVCRAVITDYHSGGQVPYPSTLHDPDTDETLAAWSVIRDLRKRAGVTDGEEVEIIMRRTGRRTDLSKMRLVAAHTYRREPPTVTS